MPRHAQQLNGIFKYTDVIFSSSLNSSELNCNTMMVSCTFPRMFRIERQMFPGRGPACRNLACFCRSWTAGSTSSEQNDGGLFESTWSHDFCISILSCCNKLSQNNRNIFSHSSGSQKSKVKVSASLVPSGGSEGEPSVCFHPSFWGPQPILGTLWLLDALLQCLCESSYHPSPLCVFSSSFFL